jgi:heme exporter protein D
VNLGPHSAFIVAAYAVATAVVLLLVVWLRSDYRTQRRLLAELESQGVSRRSSPTQRPAS